MSASIHEAMSSHLAVARAKVAENETGTTILVSSDAVILGVVVNEIHPRAEVGKVEGDETAILGIQGLYELAAACVAVADMLAEREKREPSV